MTHGNDQNPDRFHQTSETEAKSADLLEKSAVTALEFLPPIEKPANARALTRADQAFDLRIAGKSYRAIAQMLGIDVAVAHRLVQRRLREICNRMANETGPTLLVQELERLDALYEVALARAIGGPMLDRDGEPVLDRDGNPRMYEPDHRWAMRAQELIKTRAELLGLTKTKIEITGADGGPVQSRTIAVNLDNMTPGQIAALEIMLGRMGVPAFAGALPAPVVAGELAEPAADAPNEPEGDD